MTNSIAPLKILWADDQPEVVASLALALGPLMGELTHVPNGDDAVRSLERNVFDIVIADLQMPPGDWGGLELLRKMGSMQGLTQIVPVLVVSGAGTMQQVIQAKRLGARDYVQKELVQTDLEPTVRRVIEKFSQERPLNDYAAIRKIERVLHSTIVPELEALAVKRGQRDIFVGVVPREIALKTYERYRDEKGVGDQKVYLDLLDFGKMIDALWSESEAFRLLERILKTKTRDQRIKWLSALNQLRKTVAHPMRGELDQAQRDELREIESLVDRWSAEVAKLANAQLM